MIFLSEINDGKKSFPCKNNIVYTKIFKNMEEKNLELRAITAEINILSKSDGSAIVTQGKFNENFQLLSRINLRR